MDRILFRRAELGHTRPKCTYPQRNDKKSAEWRHRRLEELPDATNCLIITVWTQQWIFHRLFSTEGWCASLRWWGRCSTHTQSHFYCDTHTPPSIHLMRPRWTAAERSTRSGKPAACAPQGQFRWLGVWTGHVDNDHYISICSCREIPVLIKFSTNFPS